MAYYVQKAARKIYIIITIIVLGSRFYSKNEIPFAMGCTMFWVGAWVQTTMEMEFRLWPKIVLFLHYSIILVSIGQIWSMKKIAAVPTTKKSNFKY